LSPAQTLLAADRLRPIETGLQSEDSLYLPTVSDDVPGRVSTIIDDSFDSSYDVDSAAIASTEEVIRSIARELWRRRVGVIVNNHGFI